MKKFIAVALFIAAIAALTACGSSKGDKKSAEATTEAYVEEEVTPVDLKSSEYVDLGDYKGLTVEVEKVKVTDKDVDDEINALLEGYVDYKPIDGRDVVEKGDYVNISYTTKINGKKDDTYSSEDYDVKVGEGDLDETLGYGLGDDFKIEEKVIGSKLGDTVSVEYTFPKDYIDEDVAGKKAKTEVTINSISQEIIPTIDEYVKKYEKGKTADQYKAEIRKELEEQAQTDADDLTRQKLWQMIVDNSKQKKDFTKEMIEQEKKNLVIENEEFAEFYYGMNVEDFIKEISGMTIDEYAVFSLKSQCVEDMLTEAEKIKVSDEELKKEKEKIAKENDFDNVNEVSEYYPDEDILNDLKTQKLYDKLLSYNTVKVKEVDAPADDKKTDDGVTVVDAKDAPADDKKTEDGANDADIKDQTTDTEDK